MLSVIAHMKSLLSQATAVSVRRRLVANGGRTRQ
jgi:hypothetical protein